MPKDPIVEATAETRNPPSHGLLFNGIAWACPLILPLIVVLGRHNTAFDGSIVVGISTVPQYIVLLVLRSRRISIGAFLGASFGLTAHLATTHLIAALVPGSFWWLGYLFTVPVALIGVVLIARREKRLVAVSTLRSCIEGFVAMAVPLVLVTILAAVY